MEQVSDSQLTVSRTSDIIAPEGFVLISIAEYEQIRQTLIRFQQIMNPKFGLERLQTGKERRRNG